jgi:hypothetical protein
MDIAQVEDVRTVGCDFVTPAGHWPLPIGDRHQTFGTGFDTAGGPIAYGHH